VILIACGHPAAMCARPAARVSTAANGLRLYPRTTTPLREPLARAGRAGVSLGNPIVRFVARVQRQTTGIGLHEIRFLVEKAMSGGHTSQGNEKGAKTALSTVCHNSIHYRAWTCVHASPSTSKPVGDDDRITDCRNLDSPPACALVLTIFPPCPYYRACRGGPRQIGCVVSWRLPYHQQVPAKKEK
jgi:hypothetical protein